MISEDAMRWTPAREADSHGRVPWENLHHKEQQALRDWCRLHDIDHNQVPIDGSIEHVGGHWHVEVLAIRDGRTFKDQTTGDIATENLIRPYRAPLPWRRPATATQPHQPATINADGPDSPHPAIRTPGEPDAPTGHTTGGRG